MKNCQNCRKTNCEYRNVAFKNMTIRCFEGCPLEIRKACQEIATPEFRKAIEQLRENSHLLCVHGAKGILVQAECILNAADDVRA